MSRIGTLLHRSASFVVLGGMLLAGAAGCHGFHGVSTGKWMDTAWLDQTPAQPVKEVFVYWQNHVLVSQDEMNGKKPLPGLAGRVMFSSANSTKMVEATGEVVVQLFDMTNTAPGAAPPKLAQWSFDPIALKQLLREDRFGLGYTLFLPWDGYRSDIKAVQVQLYYFPQKGVPPIHAEPQTMVLETNAPAQPRLQSQNFTSSPAAVKR